ncbi:MAG: hypothetical protein PHW69_01200 [Elusimicrobiaceae bacterium]|nr:hypothetical protein [Elusimicrobiaceae bacterium]
MPITRETRKIMEFVARESIDRASLSLERLLHNGASIEAERVCFEDITIATQRVNSSERKVVGAYLDLAGDVTFRLLFYVVEEDSLKLADLMLNRPLGTCAATDALTLSAVQETGNILSGAIMGVFTKNFNLLMQPTPPQVVTDFEGTVFSEYLLSADIETDEVLIIECMIKLVECGVRCRMYLIPKTSCDTFLDYISDKRNTEDKCQKD